MSLFCLLVRLISIYSEFYVDHNLPPIAPTSDEHIELVYQSLRQKIPELLHVLKTPKAEYQALINPQAFVVGGRNHVISLDQAARGKLWEKLKDRSLQISKEIDSTSALISVATDYLEKGVVIGFTVIFSNAPLLLKLIMLLSPIWIGVDLYFQMKKHRVQFENQDSVAASSTLEKAIVNQKQAYHKLWNVLIYMFVFFYFSCVNVELRKFSSFIIILDLSF